MKNKLLFFLILGSFISCEAIFVEDISSAQVVLLAPINDSKVLKGVIKFNWEEVLEAAQYEVQIAKPNFEGASEILLDSLTNAKTISKNLDVGVYEWRVKAMNSEYATQYATQRFVIN